MRLRSPLLLALAVVGCTRANGNVAPPVSPPDLSPAPSTLTLDVPALADATIGVFYQATLKVTGDDAGAATWSIADGGLPPGLALDSTVGPSVRIAGTPTTKGNFRFTVDVRGPAGGHDARALALTVGDGLAIDGSLPGATEGQPYSAKLAPRGGHGKSFIWSLAGGALPVGISLGAGGDGATLTGTPAPGTATFTVALADDAGEHATRTFTLPVQSTLHVSHEAAPKAVQGAPFSLPLAVSGGIANYHWSLSGNVPPGLALTGGGASVTLGGTPTASGPFSFRVEVSDDNRGSASAPLALTVEPALQLLTDHLADGQAGVAYAATLTALGGVSTAYQWSVSAGALPPGLTLATGSGAAPPARLTGTPSTVGHFTFEITVATASGDSAKRSFTLAIGANPPHITTTTLADATWGTAYDGTLSGVSAVGGTIAWHVVAGTPPPGLTLAASTGTSVHLQGTPTLVGTFSFTVQMSDAGGSDEKQLTLTVARRAGLELLGAILPPARAGKSYSASVETRGAVGALTWSVDSGALPPGLSIAANGTSAVVSGTPGANGWFPFTLRAVDAAAHADTRAFAIGVAPVRIYAAGTTWASTSSTTYSASETVREVQARSPGAMTVLATGLTTTSVPVPSFSPAGDWLLYPLANSGTTAPLYAADLRGAMPAAPTQVSSFYGNLVWAADDRKLFSLVPVPGVSDFEFNVDVTDFSGAAPTTSQVNGAVAAGQAAWSADGTRLAYWTSNRNAINVVTGATTTSIAIPASLGSPTWFGSVASPWAVDGSGLLFAARDTTQANFQLFFVDAGGSQPPFALTDRSIDVDYNQIFGSTDGGGLAFSTVAASDHTSDVWFVDLRSRQLARAVKVNGSLAQQFLPLQWSPDSRKLLLPVEEGTPLVIARDQIGSVQPSAINVGSAGAADYPCGTWTGDSAHLLYAPKSEGLYELALDGSAPVQLTADYTQGYWSVSNTRRAYAFQQAGGDRGLFFVTVTGSAAAPPQAIDAADYNAGNFAVSRALETIFYSSQSKTIYMADLSGSSPAQPAQLFAGAGNWTFFTVAP